MIIPEGLKKYKEIPVDCPKYDKNNPDYRCSLDYDKSNYRKRKAAEEAKKEKICIFKIIDLVNFFCRKSTLIANVFS